jgi:GNAT superfamily N-acetyltransferase
MIIGPASPDRPHEPDGLPSGTSFDYAAELEQAQQPESTTGEQIRAVPEGLGNEALDLLFEKVEYEWRKYNDFDRPTPPSFKTDDEVTETALQFLADKPVGYEVRPTSDDPEEAARGEKVQLAIGGQAIAGVRFYVKGDVADLDFIGVHERLERKGFGRRLMQAAVAYMKDRGITELTSRNLSRDGFNNRLRVFGPDALSFYYTDEHREYGLTGPHPANTQEAREALERAYAQAEAQGDIPDRGEAPATFAVRVNLADVDAAGWESPVPATVDEKRVTYLGSGEQKK